MRKRNYGHHLSAIKQIKVAGIESSVTEMRSKIDGSIRIKVFEMKDNVILVDRLHEIITNLKTNYAGDERIEKIISGLDKVLAPVKNCKRIPALSGSKRILEVLGEEMGNEPEPLKELREKCINIQSINKEIERTKKARESMYNRV